MFINSLGGTKRKFNELCLNTFDSNLKKISKINKKKNNSKSNNSGDGDEGDEEGEELPLKLPKLFSHEENNLIYLKDNHLYFHTEVNEETVDEVKKLMRVYWNKFIQISKSHSCIEFKPKPLYLHIFSPGGCVLSGLSLHDFILEYKKKIPVYTVVEGRVASAATFFSVIGTKRYITPNSYILIHQLSTFFGGNFQQIEDEFENSKKYMERIMKIYKTYTNIDKKKLPSILKHDLNWDSDECIKYGMVDEVKLIDIFNDDDDN